MSKAHQNILRDFSCFALAIKFVFIYEDKKIPLYLIRDVNKLYYAGLPGVVVTYNHTLVKDSRMFAFLESKAGLLTRLNLSNSCFYTKEDLMQERAQKKKDRLTMDTTSPIFEWLTELLYDSGTCFWNCEPPNAGVLNIIKRMSSNCSHVSFPLSGRLNEKNAYMEDEMLMYKRVQAMKKAIDKLRVGEDDKTFHFQEHEKSQDTTISDLRSIVSDFEEKINVKMLDKYQRSRHEVLNSTTRLALGLEASASDQKVKDYFDYHGVDCRLTPDIIYRNPRNGKYYLLDVQVTSSDISYAYNRKVSKYQFVAKCIEEATGKDVEAEAIVMSCKLLGQMNLPSFLKGSEVMFQNIQRDIVSIQDIVEKHNGYAEARTALNERAKEEERKELYEDTKIFLETYLEFLNFEEKRACSLEESFDAPNSSQSMNMKTNAEDVLVQKIKDRLNHFDADSYIKETYKKIRSLVNSNIHPKSLEGTYETYDVAELKIAAEKEALKIRKRALEKPFFKIPKVFRFPDVIEETSDMVPAALDIFGRFEEVIGDDIYRYRPYKEDFEEPKVEMREGIGCDRENDVKMMDEMVGILGDRSSKRFRDKMRATYKNADEKMLSMFELKIFEVMHNLTELGLNITYMEGRRLVKSDKFTVYRAYPEHGYGLAIKAGSRLTEDAQIRYKVVSTGNERNFIGFHSLRKVPDYEGLVSSKWLSISTSDLETMVTLFEKGVSLAYHYMECFEESSGKRMMDNLGYLKSNAVMIPLIAMMEMKKGTALTLQYNRYVFMSMTSFMSDSKKTYTEIMNDPVRSLVESYVRIKQLDWGEVLRNVRKEVLLGSIGSLYDTSSDYDRMMVPTIFGNGEKVEFSVIMNDIYLGNLYQKEMGFAGHRAKPIVEKLAKEERHFQKIKNKVTMNGDLQLDDVVEEENTKHMFNMEFTFLMGVRLGEKLRSDPRYYEVMSKGVSQTLHRSMTMKSSLLETRGKFETLMCRGRKKTDICHKTLMLLIEEHGTSVTSALVSKENVIEALFSCFAKIALTGPREILVQSYKLRPHVNLLERVFESICGLLDKDMISDDGEKEYLQSSKASELRSEAQSRRDNSGECGILFNYIADASKWSPSFVMPQFIAFLLALRLPKELEEAFISVMRAFSSKMVMIPETLMRKWEKKPRQEKEMNPDAQWARENSEGNDWILRVISSMGQGQMHYFSSALHVAKDDITDIFLDQLAKESEIYLRMYTQISSDDAQKQILVTSDSLEKNIKFMPKVLDVIAFTGELSNIHINTKKTQISPHVGEFNSNFTRGKRAILAVIKDIFNATQVVDLTEPRKAVKGVVENISRAYRNGAFNKTVRCMFVLMREWLIRAYGMNKGTIHQLKTLLNCEDDMLPSELGFLSLRHYQARCILGEEMLMFDPNNSSELNLFYRNLFTGMKLELEENVSEDYISAMSGRLNVTLPVRSDKTMMELMKNHLREKNIGREEVMKMMEGLSLIADHSEFSWIKHRIFDWPYFMQQPRDYENGVSMKLHSLVRALQFVGSKLKCRPKVSSSDSFTIVTFTEMVLSRINFPSSIEIMSPNKVVMAKVMEASNLFDFCVQSDGQRHTRKRKMLFRTREVAMSADINDIMNFMMGDNSKFSNRLMCVMESVCEMCGFDPVEFKANPIKTVLTKFSFTDYPMFCFRKIMEEFILVRSNFSVEVMVSSMDRGNIVDNLLSLYCEREEPFCMLKPGTNSSMHHFISMMETWIAMCRSPDTFPIDLVPDELVEKRETLEIRTADSALERGMKMLIGNLKGVELTSTHIFTHSHKVRNRDGSRETITIYCDLRDLLVVKYDHFKKVAYHEFMSLDKTFNVNGQLMKIYQMDYRMEGNGEYTRYYYDKKRIYLSFTESTRKVYIEPKIKYLTSVWKMSLFVSWDDKLVFYPFDSGKLRIFSNQYVIYSEVMKDILRASGDRKYIKSFNRMRHCDMSLEEVQTFMKENSLFSEQILLRKEQGSSELRKAYESLENELMAFAASGSIAEPSNLFNRNFDELLTEASFKMSEDPSDIDDLLDWIDEDFLKIAMDLMNDAPDENDTDSDPHERLYMAKLIFQAIGSAFNREYDMVDNTIVDFFKRGRESRNRLEEGEIRWNSIASQLLQAGDCFEDWFYRLILCHIYSRLCRRGSVQAPDKVTISSKELTTKWIWKKQMLEAEKEMYENYESEYPTLAETFRNKVAHWETISETDKPRWEDDLPSEEDYFSTSESSDGDDDDDNNDRIAKFILSKIPDACASSDNYSSVEDVHGKDVLVENLEIPAQIFSRHSAEIEKASESDSEKKLNEMKMKEIFRFPKNDLILEILLNDQMSNEEMTEIREIIDMSDFFEIEFADILEMLKLGPTLSTEDYQRAVMEMQYLAGEEKCSEYREMKNWEREHIYFSDHTTDEETAVESIFADTIIGEEIDMLNVSEEEPIGIEMQTWFNEFLRESLMDMVLKLGANETKALRLLKENPSMSVELAEEIFMKLEVSKLEEDNEEDRMEEMQQIDAAGGMLDVDDSVEGLLWEIDHPLQVGVGSKTSEASMRQVIRSFPMWPLITISSWNLFECNQRMLWERLLNMNDVERESLFLDWEVYKVRNSGMRDKIHIFFLSKYREKWSESMIYEEALVLYYDKLMKHILKK